MGARFFKLLPVLLWACGSTALSSPEPALQIDQTILEAHAQLVEAGWMPAPTQTPSERERRWAGVTLKSLSSCSGNGVGFCRFDYQQKANGCQWSVPSGIRNSVNRPCGAILAERGLGKACCDGDLSCLSRIE